MYHKVLCNYKGRTMNELHDPQKDLSEIRSMMDRSTKILSLSGLAGITIGLVTIGGALYAQWIQHHIAAEEIQRYLIIDALAVLAIAAALSVFFSSRMAKKKGIPLWTPAGRYLITELAIPLAAGGVFCSAAIIHKTFFLLPAIMLTFYGLALVNASKFAVKEVRYLGLTQLTIGLLAALIPGEGMNFWVLGFGVMHILYGVRIYLKYEK